MASSSGVSVPVPPPLPPVLSPVTPTPPPLPSVSPVTPTPPPLPPVLSPVTPTPPPLPPSPVTPSPPKDYLTVPYAGLEDMRAVPSTNKLRPLYWEKIQENDCSSSDNVWSTLPISITYDVVDQKDLQKLFHTRLRRTSSNRNFSGSGHTIRLLPPRKSQALAIVLRNLPDGAELKEMIANLDCEALDPSILVALADVLPSGDEIQRIKAYCSANPRAALDVPERFVLQISSIDFFKEKSKCLLYQSQFYEKLALTRQRIEALNTACKLLFRNNELSKVLGLVLAIGNRMNAGSVNRGGANGFKLDLLGKLRDVRSNDRESNLLQFLVQCYLKTADIITDEYPLPCPVQLAAAAQTSLEDIQSNLEFLGCQLKDCEALCVRLKKAANDFYKKINNFLKKAHEDLCAAESEAKELSIFCKELLKYYCVPDSSVQEFLNLWIPFLQSFKHYWEREKSLVARQKLADLQAERLRATPTQPISHNGLKARLKNRTQLH